MMTSDSGRQAAGRRRRTVLVTVGGLVAVAAACFSGTSKDATAPSGAFGIQGGGTGGSSGASFQGTYRLLTVSGQTVPAQLFYDSTTGAADTIFAATFDSSFISLNSDSSAREIDYLTFRDIRSDSAVHRIEIFGDTTGGFYRVSGTSVTLTLNDTVGGPHQVITQYTGTNNQITALLTYSLYNTGGGFVTTDTATVVYALSGPPLSDRVPPHAVSPRTGSASASAIRAPLRFSAPPPSRTRP